MKRLSLRKDTDYREVYIRIGSNIELEIEKRNDVSMTNK
jgi:hypothetical protein